jgi:hypothetical protein
MGVAIMPGADAKGILQLRILKVLIGILRFRKTEKKKLWEGCALNTNT